MCVLVCVGVCVGVRWCVCVGVCLCVFVCVGVCNITRAKQCCNDIGDSSFCSAQIVAPPFPLGVQPTSLNMEFPDGDQALRPFVDPLC